MASTINGTSTGSGGLISTGDDSGILNIQTNETTAITVDTSQNVGIGTSSPSDKLEVSRVSGSNSTGGLSLTNSDASGYGSAVTWRLKLDAVNVVNVGRIVVEAGSATATFMPFQTTVGSTLAERMRIDTSGNVNIGGTSGNGKLNVITGNVNLSDDYSLTFGTQGAYLNGSTASNYLRFFTNSAERMRITSAGVVQVGNNSGTGEVFAQNTVKVWGVINSGSTTFYNSFGTSSISKISTGIFAIGFSRTFASSRFGSGVTQYGSGFSYLGAESTTGVRINTTNSSGTLTDSDVTFLIAGAS